MLRKKLNLRKGDVVAIMLPNIPEYPVCLLGSIEAGLTATLINPLYTPGNTIFTVNYLTLNTAFALFSKFSIKKLIL